MRPACGYAQNEPATAHDADERAVPDDLQRHLLDVYGQPGTESIPLGCAQG